MKFINKLVLIFIVLLVVIPVAIAKEGGDQSPNGAENWLVGVLPPKGSYFVNYLGYYHGELRDGSGRKVSLGGSTPSVDAVFDAFRFVQVTPFKVLGADYAMHVIVPIAHQSMNFGGNASKFDVGDIIFNPFILGWHGKHWHAVTGLDIIMPSGHYDSADPRLCVGSNYFSFEPVFAFTYLSEQGWETGVKFMYNTKTTNGDTKYHSGDEFHFDYVAGKHIGPWSVGASGYFLKQVTDDKIAGVVVPETPGLWSYGRRGQVLAVGPSIGYTNKRHMTFSVQYQHETLVENRFGGDKVWFKAVIPLSALGAGPRN